MAAINAAFTTGLSNTTARNESTRKAPSVVAAESKERKRSVTSRIVWARQIHQLWSVYYVRQTFMKAASRIRFGS